MLIDRFSVQFEQQEGVIIENPVDIRYLTGANVEQGILVVAKDSNLEVKTHLFVDDRFFLSVLETNKKNPEALNKIKVCKLHDFKKQVADVFDLSGVKTVYLETGYLTLNRYREYLESLANVKIEFFSDFVSNSLATLRLRKTKVEISKIKEAQRLTDEAFSYIINIIKPGMTEKQVATELKKKVLDLGSEDFAFEYIVVSGENTSIPHGRPSDRELKKGDAVIIDFGAKVDGYCSDMTRTVFIARAGEEKRTVYEKVLSAQKRAIAQVKIGVQASKIDKIARDYISKKGYGEFFTHGLGHGVGLQVHEKPNLSPNSKDLIADKQILTIEPGIYIPGQFGVRIEDMLLIDRDIRGEGREILTQSPKTLLLI